MGFFSESTLLGCDPRHFTMDYLTDSRTSHTTGDYKGTQASVALRRIYEHIRRLTEPPCNTLEVKDFAAGAAANICNTANEHVRSELAQLFNFALYLVPAHIFKHYYNSLITHKYPECYCLLIQLFDCNFKHETNCLEQFFSLNAPLIECADSCPTHVCFYDTDRIEAEAFALSRNRDHTRSLSAATFRFLYLPVEVLEFSCWLKFRLNFDLQFLYFLQRICPCIEPLVDQFKKKYIILLTECSCWPIQKRIRFIASLKALSFFTIALCIPQAENNLCNDQCQFLLKVFGDDPCCLVDLLNVPYNFMNKF